MISVSMFVRAQAGCVMSLRMLVCVTIARPSVHAGPRMMGASHSRHGSRQFHTLAGSISLDELEAAEVRGHARQAQPPVQAGCSSGRGPALSLEHT